jgi:hypothetical protein
LPKENPTERIAKILPKVRSSAAYKDLTDLDRQVLFLTTGSVVALRHCGRRVEFGSGTATRYPNWIDVIGANMSQGELYSPSGLIDNREAINRRLLAWALIGMLSDDDNPCEVAEIIYKSYSTLK